jgi:hypothetical protein
MLACNDSSKILNKKHNREKMGILGEQGHVQLKPSKNPIKPKGVIKIVSSFKIPKNESIKPLRITKENPSIPLN